MNINLYHANAVPAMKSGHKVTDMGLMQMTPLFGNLKERTAIWCYVEDGGEEVTVPCDMEGIPIDPDQRKRYAELVYDDKYAMRHDWVYKHFGNYSRMAERIGVSVPSVSRWMKEKPTKFLEHINVLKESGESVETIVTLFS